MIELWKRVGQNKNAVNGAKKGFFHKFIQIVRTVGADFATTNIIDVLKNGRVDTALLGELVAHKDFMKLLGDINIYVKGFTTMQIHTMDLMAIICNSFFVSRACLKKGVKSSK